ncbi:MAG: TonB system transport protein ExbD [Acetobacteraceae bacterium]
MATLGSNPLNENEIAEQSEINVTPFIDVMLVLLIIFMIAAPISTVDVPVDLPASVADPQPRPDKPIYVTIRADLTLAVGEEDTEWSRLASSVDMATGVKRDTRLFIRADKSVPYGEIMKLFNELRVNGYLKVAMVALEQGGSMRPPETGETQP